MTKKEALAQLKRSREMHKVVHDFERYTKSKTGYDLMEAAKRWAGKNPERIFVSRIDDAHHSSSSIAFITHENETHFMGTTAIVIPQNSGPPCEFFLYPNHVDDLIRTLQKIKKNSKRKKEL